MAQLASKGGTPVRTERFPFWPVWGDEEIENLTAVIKSGKWGCLHGTLSDEFERKFAAYQDAKYGILVNSGTTALKIALTAAGIGAGDQVIVPAYTFIASASSIIEAGAVPVFVDIDPHTFNIDVDHAAELLTSATRAIMPVHFAGRPADMDAVLALAKKHDLVVIEDAAQAWGSEWRGTGVGALGQAGTFSFQSSKNINAGEGGIIITNDDLVAKMARAHNNCGRSQEGQWYEHFYFGGNTRITELQSAVLLAQFGRYPEQMKIRQDNMNYLNQELAAIEGIKVLAEDARITSQSVHLFIFQYRKEFFAGKDKSLFIDAMRKEGIPTSPGYSIPLYKQPVFQKKAFGPRGRAVDLPIDYTAVVCPQTEKACFEEAVWFTQNVLLGTREDMDDIVEAIVKIKVHAEEL
ncbi:DegT/DnrJ/EryC1/StrS family aminotransferase [candidate division KSB1 bacterium]|nr:DegT/DnrJ/EryC1/StrS family aminotransferase [candidate division KSB1 bacterium]RQW01388.1 MAG: DegT/DnrJ/EryC1/StrS family aminotransferase [candidate division KSB1 bacterium]